MELHFGNFSSDIYFSLDTHKIFYTQKMKNWDFRMENVVHRWMYCWNEITGFRSSGKQLEASNTCQITKGIALSAYHVDWVSMIASIGYILYTHKQMKTTQLLELIRLTVMRCWISPQINKPDNPLNLRPVSPLRYLIGILGMTHPNSCCALL
jgi:hypothetical protein